MLHMQRIMIEKLNCSNWDKVVQYHLGSSISHVMEKYMLLFGNTVNCSPRFYFIFLEVCLNLVVFTLVFEQNCP